MVADPPPLLAVVGPTASGKSQIAYSLARALGGEIVSCDSVQVYRGFDIGSAKPSAVERRTVPHHLVDVADWDDDFDAAQYRGLAEEAISDIRRRGATPIVCGGTGLYLRALRWGLLDLPPSNPAIRERLMEEARADLEGLVARLESVDPESAATIDIQNPVRVARALEIFELTGERASDLRTQHGFRDEEVPMRVVALKWEDTTLRERIEKRVEQMLNDGLLGEVRNLLDSGVTSTCRPMGAVGYRECVEVVDGRAEEAGLAERIAHSTWGYARRQRTWFRKERDVELVDVTDSTVAAKELLASLR